METRIITISTRRSDYSVAEAAKKSMTVDELIEELRYLPGGFKVGPQHVYPGVSD